MTITIAAASRRRMNNVLLAASVVFAAHPRALGAQTTGYDRAQRLAADATLPAWTRQTGARRQPTSRRVCSANAQGAKGDSVTNSTVGIQKAIDACSRSGGGRVQFSAGQYVTGALFLKHDVELRVDSGVTLLG